MEFGRKKHEKIQDNLKLEAFGITEGDRNVQIDSKSLDELQKIAVFMKDQQTWTLH